jgi:hypothetical protein
MAQLLRTNCLFFCIFLILGCSNKIPKVDSLTPIGGICLSFDDANIDNWYSYLDLFDEYNVKVTFYVSHFDKMTTAQKQKLHEIENRGHEIAFHTLTHPNMVKKAKSVGAKTLINNEIKKGIALMKLDNFCPKSFAYPFGSNNLELSDSLLKYFKSLRCLNGSKDYAKSFVKNTGNSVTYAIGLDNSSNKTTEFIMDLEQKAFNNNTCLMLVAHNIERPSTNLQVPLVKIKAILNKARELNLKFYRAIDIARR